MISFLERGLGAKDAIPRNSGASLANSRSISFSLIKWPLLLAALLVLLATWSRQGPGTVRPLQGKIPVASNGGALQDPAWYLNLVEHPDVRLQVGAERFTARARTADAGEKPPLWRLMTSIFPLYESYQTKTDRDIPLVILEPLSAEVGHHARGRHLQPESGA